MTDQQANAANIQVDDFEQRRVRLEKRARLLERGIEAYPVELPITHSLQEIRDAYPDLAVDATTGDLVGIAGRIIHVRNSGKLCFAVLREGNGTELQAMISLAKVGEDSLAEWKSSVDLGDFVFVHGEVISSRRGELSVLADSWQMAAKAIRPLPVTHKELSEEARVRQRYLDLIVRPEAMRTVRTRAAVVRSLRESLQGKGFIEVETPMLNTLHGGFARPFITHSNSLDIDLYLRIAPELYLKRCLVGGIEKVFEINRNFRNEGIDASHSPEFTMLEFYQAYGTYDSVATLTRELVQKAAEAAFGTQIVTLADGTEYDLSGQWAELTMYESLSEVIGEPITPETSVEQLRKHAEAREIEVNPLAGHGKLIEELWESLVGDHLYAPTFVREFPVETAPLTRQHRSKPGVAEKWDLYIRGFELGTGYSELVDPVIEREYLTAQAKLAAAGDEEAMPLDEDFLRALEHGMPPTGGVGIGIDRLLMALTGLGVRETILFPLVKPE